MCTFKCDALQTGQQKSSNLLKPSFKVNRPQRYNMASCQNNSQQNGQLEKSHLSNMSVIVHRLLPVWQAIGQHLIIPEQQQQFYFMVLIPR